MQTVQEYLEAIPETKRGAVKKLRDVVRENLPDGFAEQMAYGMISYVIPLSRYPKGYHAQDGEPLPFLSIAAQKSHIALYHMGLYGQPKMMQWFVSAYSTLVPTKLDMGKSCIRFRNPKHIPFDLIAELCRKMSVDDYISVYEQSFLKR